MSSQGAPNPHQTQQNQSSLHSDPRSHESNVGQAQPRRGDPSSAIHTQSGVPFGHVPAYLPGSASLVEELDKHLLIVLRDGKHIVGVRIVLKGFSPPFEIGLPSRSTI